MASYYRLLIYLISFDQIVILEQKQEKREWLFFPARKKWAERTHTHKHTETKGLLWQKGWVDSPEGQSWFKGKYAVGRVIFSNDSWNYTMFGYNQRASPCVPALSYPGTPFSLLSEKWYTSFSYYKYTNLHCLWFSTVNVPSFIHSLFLFFASWSLGLAVRKQKCIEKRICIFVGIIYKG